MPSSAQIRQQFLDYFAQKHGHKIVPSSPVVPHADPTLLFTNAGMNQFKDVFLGTGSREYRRAVNSQKCIRAGGKHNDLEDVGKDTYHFTFFEMLGNWSFGDYFKAEAIAWSLDLLTGVWGLKADRIHATYFEGDPAEHLEPDLETRDLWLEHLPADRVHPGSKKDNFWEMGETGPCGPCSEVHYDRTPDKSGADLVNANDPRVIEIWNLVFIQFNRDSNGTLDPLPAKHVDTGMGFERISAVLQGHDSCYDTDIFSPIFAGIRKVTGTREYGGSLEDRTDIAYRVIADHIRTLSFALTDGAVPSNEGRGYVLRRILRRAVRHGRQTLGVHEPFLHRLVPTVVDAMGQSFPELKKDPKEVMDLIEAEEKAFGRTIDRGIALFEDLAGRGGKAVSGRDAFELYTTHGFPLDLTQVMAKERGLTVDVAGFESEMLRHAELSRDHGRGGEVRESLIAIVQKQNPPATQFTGYGQMATTADTFCLIYRLLGDHYEPAPEATVGDHAAMVLGRTPFYAEAGGQVGDVGFIENDAGGIFEVQDTIKVGEVIFHLGKVGGGKWTTCATHHQARKLTLHVDGDRRSRIMKNHTATHMLNRALRDLVNPHADQRGSLVDDQKTRFDFSNPSGLSPEQIDQVEQQVNADITADMRIDDAIVEQEQARKINGLRAVFGEKYPPKVRVISIGAPLDEVLCEVGNEQWRRYSIEFCGGTHLKRTSNAEGFAIVAEEAVAKGIRRITALTGASAHQARAQGEMLLARAGALQQSVPDDLAEAATELTTALSRTQVPALLGARIRQQLAEIQKILKKRQKDAGKKATNLVVDTARRIAEQEQGKIIVAAIDGADGNTLRDAMDIIRKKKPHAALLLGATDGKKVAFIAAVPKDLITQGLKAGDWVRQVAQAAGGGGGGRPDMAQAGGKDPSKLEVALEVGRKFAEGKL